MHNSYVVPATEPPAEEKVSFLGLVNFLLRNLVLLLVAGIAFAAVLVMRRAASSETYTATTSFATGQGEAPGRLLGLSFGGMGSERSPQFYADLVKSSAILRPLVELKFNVEGAAQPITLIELYSGSKSSSQAATEAAMGAVAGRIQTKISPLTNVITMRVTASQPKLASDIASAILKEIDLFNTRTRKAQTTAERAFSEDRLVEIQSDVRVTENKLRDFMERNRDISLSPALILEKERLRDEVVARRQIYNTVLLAYERAKMEEVRESPLVTIISEPTPPLGKDPKGFARLAVLGFFAGFLIAVVFALWREYLKTIGEKSSPEYQEFARLRTRAMGIFRRPVRSSPR